MHGCFVGDQNKSQNEAGKFRVIVQGTQATRWVMMQKKREEEEQGEGEDEEQNEEDYSRHVSNIRQSMYRDNLKNRPC